MILFCPLEEIGNTLCERQIEHGLSVKFNDRVVSTLYTHNFSEAEMFDLICDCKFMAILVDADNTIDERTINLLPIAGATNTPILPINIETIERK